MQVDDAPPLRLVKELFAAYPRPYWIAGGWAVDLHVGRQRREHADVDVLILADDLETFVRVFADRGIAVDDHRTAERRPWAPDGATGIEPGRHTLALLDSPGVEVMLALSDGPDWVFHRGRRSRRPLADITQVSPGGLPYVGPELVLLFKARDRRGKDEQDFRDLAPRLSADQREWLIPRLSPPGGADHPWTSALVGPRITPFGPADVEWAAAMLTEAWGAPVVVSRGVLRDPLTLPGFVARADGAPVGLVTYHITGDECEIVSINGYGVGAALLDAAVDQGRRAGCRRAWLVTTNDNTRALRFYQRQGWDLAALHLDAVTEARRLKPGIPPLGLDDIPIRHELELELRLRD